MLALLPVLCGALLTGGAQPSNDRIIGAFTHTRLHHIDVPMSTVTVDEAQPMGATGAARGPGQLGAITGAYAHSSLHHIEVPVSQSVAAEPKVMDAGAAPVQLLKTFNGEHTHTSLHHIEVP